MLKTQLAYLALAAAIFSPAGAQTVWNLASAYPDTNLHTRNLKQFADEVAKDTDGKLKIVVHGSGSLIKMPEIKRAVQTGQVPAGEVFIGTMANESPLYSFDSIPFMVADRAQGQALWGAVRPLVEARLGKQNLHVLYSVAWPATGLYTKNALKGPTDFKGMKFRAPSSSMADFAKRLGAVPTVVQAADIPQAFLTGQVDAMLTSSLTGVESQSWDYLTSFYHVPTMVPQNIVFVNQQAWSKLDPAVQKAVTAAAQRAEARGWELGGTEDAASAAKLKERGLAVLQPSAEIMTLMKDTGTKMAADWKAKLSDEERAAVDSVVKK